MTGFVALLRRELWEHRSILIVPATLAGLILSTVLGSAIYALVRGYGLEMVFDNHWHSNPDTVEMGRHVPAAFIAMAAFFGIVLAINVTLYLVDCLYADRRDRSILFWKSLPVSDRTTVLAKASVPFVIIPLLSFVITVFLQATMLLLGSVVLLASGLSAAALWAEVPLPHMWFTLVYHLVTVHALWYAPIYAWLLLVSAWARRAPVLWATLPLLAICIVEKLAFNTSFFVGLLEHRLGGAPEAVLSTARGMPIDPMAHLTPIAFLSAPGLWIGLAVAAAFLAAAVRLRRDRA